jgi:hypothetical protein
VDLILHLFLRFKPILVPEFLLFLIFLELCDAILHPKFYVGTIFNVELLQAFLKVLNIDTGPEIVDLWQPFLPSTIVLVTIQQLVSAILILIG